MHNTHTNTVKIMILEHELLKKQKRRKSISKVKVDLYPLATELFMELDSLGFIQRLKEIPQLGVIRVNKNMKKSRYDYMILQLYFHQLTKNNLQSILKLTYNNVVKCIEFRDDLTYIDKKCKPTVVDMLQILTIAYNVGHFYNTFVSSRAAVMYAEHNDDFKNIISRSSSERMYQKSVEKLLCDSNYQRFHLLNSLLVLENCDQTKMSVQLAKELIYAYIDEESLRGNSKLHYVFELYRSIRDVSYISYDLQIAKTPITIDLCDASTILVLLKELLSTYNDNRSMKRLVYSMSKLLDDTIYNEESNAICYFNISKNIVKKLRAMTSWETQDYFDLWKNKSSIFNCKYPQHRDYVQDGILKLTFDKHSRDISKNLFFQLEHSNGVRVGYYDRNGGSQTIVVSLKQTCNKKEQVAFRVLKIVIKALRGIQGISMHDTRYLLAVKFFLFYLAKENPIIIKPTIDSEVCVICNKGKLRRTQVIKNLIKTQVGNEDQIHEVEHLCKVLEEDSKNDVCISIPSSILVYNKEEKGKKLCEFDGMIIFPNRVKKQVVFLEAKNRKEKPSLGKNDLSDKLKMLQIPFEKNKIQVIGKDAALYYDI